MFLPMNQKDLFRFVRLCFWDSMKEFVGLAHRPPGPDGKVRLRDRLNEEENTIISTLKSATENEQIKKTFLAEPKEKGLKIIWLVRCHDCEIDLDVSVFLENDQPGRPGECPDCGGKNVDIILKGVVEG